MLGKLIKYEFKATAKTFALMYSILFVITAVCKLSLSLLGHAHITNAVMITAYILALVATVLMTDVIAVLRFYRNLIGDEAYLMFTLPVKPYEHIVSKLVVSFIWFAISGAAIVISGFIMILGKYYDAIISAIKNIFTLFYAQIGSSATLLLIIIGVLSVLSVAVGLLMLYASMALGQLYRKHRILGSVLAYIGLYMASQAISSMVVGVYMSTALLNSGTELAANTSIPLLVLSLILSILHGVAYYIITNHVFTKRLNLE